MDPKNLIKTLKTEIQDVVRTELEPINKDLKDIRQEIKTTIKTELKPIKQDIKKIRQDQNTIIKFFDEEYLDLRQRVEILEQIVSTLTVRNH